MANTPTPKLDFSMKAGQKIHVNLAGKVGQSHAQCYKVIHYCQVPKNLGSSVVAWRRSLFLQF